MTDLPQKIIALLFYHGGDLTTKEIARVLSVQEDEVVSVHSALNSRLEGTGLTVVHEAKSFALATSPEVATFMNSVREDELAGQLGKATLETLAVIIFRGPITRGDIEFVRGVNVSTSLRSLMIRGLIERKDHPTDQRLYVYSVTPQTAAHFGVASISEIPGFAEHKASIDALYP